MTRVEQIADRLKSKYKWSKVKAPQTWYPKFPGEELVGFYGGRTMKSGMYGQYEVVLVHIPGSGSFTMSGTALIRLLDASMVQMGQPIRIVWMGHKDIGMGKTMRDYELFVVEDEVSWTQEGEGDWDAGSES